MVGKNPRFKSDVGSTAFKNGLVGPTASPPEPGLKKYSVPLYLYRHYHPIVKQLQIKKVRLHEKKDSVS